MLSPLESMHRNKGKKYKTKMRNLREPLGHVTGVTAVTTRLAPREPITERRQHLTTRRTAAAAVSV